MSNLTADRPPFGDREDAHDGDEEFSDEELTARSPWRRSSTRPSRMTPVPWSLARVAMAAVLPGWYMPQALQTRCRGWRAGLVVVIIAAFLIVDTFGLCSTYG